MCVTLYAHGPVKLQVGKYGMLLNEARESFVNECNKLDLEFDCEHLYLGYLFKIRKSEQHSWKEYTTRLESLIHALSYVDDHRAKPPSVYEMNQEIVPDNDYIKVGVYDTKNLSHSHIIL